MTTPSPGRPGLTGHELLLRLAGRIPDGPLADARRLLADGDAREAINGLTRWVAGEPVPLLAAELAAIRVLAADLGALAGVRPVAVLPELPFAFTAVDPWGQTGRDAMDDSVAAVAEGRRAAGLWRSWRYRLDDPDAAAQTVRVDPDDPDQAHRVYILQVDQAIVSQAPCRDLLRAVDENGRAGVEVIPLGEEPLPYQDMALAESMLLWARPDDAEFDLARVFDFADPGSEPGSALDHALVDDPDEREQMLGYLRGGALVAATTATMNDALNPEAGAVVPMNFRTDGEWIWTDTAEYYLSRYGLAPGPDLHEHIRLQLSRGAFVPVVDDETAGRAADFLLSPPTAERE
jgi:hypothetical protein